MSPHATWFEFLPGYRALYEGLQGLLGRTWTWQMFQTTHFQLDHVMGALLVFFFLLFGASRYAAAVNGASDGGLVPPPKFGLRNLFETLADTIFNLMASVMGEKEARALPAAHRDAVLLHPVLEPAGAHSRIPAADRHAEDQPDAVGDGLPAHARLRREVARDQVLQALHGPASGGWPR